MSKNITTYSTLRDSIQYRDKAHGCVRVPRAPLIHAGFPGTFNLSFTEYHWIKEYGKYVDFDHDFIFSTVQSCVRPDDIRLAGTVEFWKYLGVFEMADLNGAVALKCREVKSSHHENDIGNLIWLLQELDISSDCIYPSYCAGGKVEELSQGKYCFDFNIPADELTKEEFLAVGVPEENLIPDKTRNTFLAVNLKKEEQNWGVSTIYTGWGYRNEINVNVGTKENKCLLDIGTFERFNWKPVYEKDEIVGLGNVSCDFSIGVVGLERLCMAANELSRIQDVDYIAPFYKRMKQLFGKEDILAGESLRALHRIYSDTSSFSIQDIGRHRKARINKMLSNIPKEFGSDAIATLLQVHTETQPWHDNLQEGIEATIDRIEKYRAC